MRLEIGLETRRDLSPALRGDSIILGSLTNSLMFLSTTAAS